MRQGYFVQIDGRCHWAGIYHRSTWEVLWLGMLQNVAAVRQGGCLVRVHARDLGDAGCTAAALECAAMGCGIVLTPAYATALVHWGHLDVPYVELLRGLVPNCRCHIDRHGNHRVFLM